MHITHQPGGMLYCSVVCFLVDTEPDEGCYTRCVTECVSFISIVSVLTSRFEIVMVVSVISVVMPYSLVQVYWCHAVF